MSIDRVVLAFAGAMVLLGLGLGLWATPYGFLLTALVGLNLIQSAFTRFCPLAIFLKKLGLASGAAFS